MALAFQVGHTDTETVINQSTVLIVGKSLEVIMSTNKTHFTI